MRKAFNVHIDDLEFVAAPQHKDTFIKPLVGEEDSPNVKTLFVKVMPGGEIVPHTHDCVEVFYILQGVGYVLLNEERRKVSAGDCIYAPAFSEHGMRNEGTEELLLLANFHKYEY